MALQNYDKLVTNLMSLLCCPYADPAAFKKNNYCFLPSKSTFDLHLIGEIWSATEKDLQLKQLTDLYLPVLDCMLLC